MKSIEFLTEVAAPDPGTTKLYALAWQLGKMPTLPLIKSLVSDFMVDPISRDLKRVVKAKKSYPANSKLAIDMFSTCDPDSGKQVDAKKMFGTDYTAVKKLHDAHWQAIWDKNDAERAAKAKPEIVKPASKIPASVSNSLAKIQTECSDILKLYKANPNKFFYRGIGTTKSLLTGQSQYREALHTSQGIHHSISDAMQELGFTAIRNNSIFVTPDYSEANEYADDFGSGEADPGAVYIFLPVNGFQFTWSPNVHDFYADWEDGRIEVDENDLKWNMKVIKFLGYTNKNLNQALLGINEVMFTGKYYMINADYKAALDNLLK